MPAFKKLRDLLLNDLLTALLQLANARKEYEAAQLAFSGAELSAELKLAGVMRAFKVRGLRPLLRYMSASDRQVDREFCMFFLEGRIPAVYLWGPMQFMDRGLP